MLDPKVDTPITHSRAAYDASLPPAVPIAQRRMLTIKHVLAMTGYTHRSSIRNLEQKRGFPRHVKQGLSTAQQGKNRWFMDEVLAWIEEQKAASRRVFGDTPEQFKRKPKPPARDPFADDDDTIGADERAA